MPARSNTPSRRTTQPRTALLIIDMINPLDFADGRQLLQQAVPVARRILRLKRRLKAAGVPAIYVNDNFGHWQHGFREIVAICAQDGVLGAPLARLLAPEADDLTVLKPQHSAFYNTPLEALLRERGASRVLLTGVAGDHCILASALDAKMRKLDLVVVRDGVASVTAERNQRALAVLRSLRIELATAGRVEP
jgi:nicotinamidase-related amidase